MITPQHIIGIIKETYNLDVTPNKPTQSTRYLKSIYFYLCVKYCNPILFGYNEIGEAVNVKHCNVTLMSKKASERIDVRGWEEYTKILKNLDFIIGEMFSDDEDYLNHIKLDGYDVLMLKRRIKHLINAKKKKDIKIIQLKNIMRNIEATA